MSWTVRGAGVLFGWTRAYFDLCPTYVARYHSCPCYGPVHTISTYGDERLLFAMMLHDGQTSIGKQAQEAPCPDTLASMSCLCNTACW